MIIYMVISIYPEGGIFAFDFASNELIVVEVEIS